MEGTPGRLQSVREYGAKRTVEIFENLMKNRLWQRQLKNIMTTTIVVSICLIPGSRDVLGKAAYLGAIATVFAYPGRRFGQLIEALILAISGMILGLAWSLLGLYLSSLVIRVHAPAAYSIRGVFLACALLLHGFLRSTTPRLFTFVLLLVIVAVVTLTSVATAVTPISATQIVYPILVAGGVILVVNLLIFPEFSASFLGDTTIRTLHETTESLRNAGFYFTETLNSTREPACSVIQKPERKAQTDNEHTRRPDQSRFASKVFMSLLSLEGGGNPSNAKMSRPQPTTLQELVGAKAGLRANLARCKEAQRECNFELAFAVLPPRDLKPIGSDSMKRFVANTIAVIGACESKFALLGEGNERVNRMPEGADRKPSDSASGHYAVNYINGRRETVPSGPILGGGQAKLDLIKPMREIEFGDVRLLQHLLARIAAPYTNLRTVMLGASDCVMVAIACTYNVTKLPSGAKTPKGLSIEEVDRNTDELSQALTTFDGDIAAALEGAVDLQESKKEEAGIMPREEVFLVASFLLNLRQAASHVEDMLRHSRALVLQHRSRHGRRRFYAPRIKWSKWLYSGGEEEEALPASGRKGNREGEENVQADDEDDADPLEPKEYPINSTDREKDLENGRNTGISPPKLAGPYSGFTAKSSAGASTIHSNQSQSLRIRGSLANGVEWAQNSEDLRYAFKLTVAVMLVTWPAFVARWNTWYSLNRGLWAALQLVFIAEVSIGNSVRTFILRAVGTTLGCLWGWAALEARNGNRIVIAAMVCVGLIPSTYVQLGTKYPKAGMISIVSICVVALSTTLQTVPGSATENFLKRWLAFVIGGVVALVVEMGLFPAKARTRLVESLTAAIRQVREMETCIAAGIEEGITLNVYDPEMLKRFECASGKAHRALAAAETFLPFCSNEPRIKGSFKALSLIYSEILFVLHQVVDRMDNMLQLRTAYGSGPLEEFNAQLYPYRHNVAGAVTLTLFAVETSLQTKIALPQYFPSARLAHLRMINRVRELLQQAMDEHPNRHAGDPVRRKAVRRKYLAWNAASAAGAEIIEYLEELVDLAKLVVGANEFRSGLLMRATYQDYVQGLTDGAAKSEASGAAVDLGNEARDTLTRTPIQSPGVNRRRRLTTIRSSGSTEDPVPASLQRIQSRKVKAGTGRQATN